MKVRLLIFLGCSTIFLGCRKFVETPEKACFIPYVDFVAHHVDPSSLEVSFTSVTSFNGTIQTHEWDFGDGTTYSGPHPPTHTYPPPASPGGTAYRIKYTVGNECGQSYWTKDITVSSCLPHVGFTYNFVNDSTVQFVNTTTSSSSASYVWNFGDGTTGTSSAANVSHTYHQDGNYTVNLKATNGCGENNYTAQVSLCRSPVPAQTVTVTGCSSVSIDASATQNGSRYQWDFGNGIILPATPSASPTISYNYPANGSYTIKLSVINPSGCDTAVITYPLSLTANSVVPNNNWSYTSDDMEFNFGRQAVTNANSYSWNFGDGTSSQLQNPGNKTYGTPGSYTVTLNANNNCGGHSFTAQINVPYYKNISNSPNTGFQDVVAISSSQIYYLGTNGKLYKTDTAGTWSSAINLPTLLSFNSDTRLFRDINNQLWIYGKKEVAKFNSSTNTWTSSFSSTGFSSSVTITSMAIDNNGAVWTTGNNQVRRGSTVLSSGNSQFSALAFAPSNNRIWITSSNRELLYYASSTGNSLSSVAVSAIVNEAEQIRVHSNGDLYFITTTGIVRANSTGTQLNNYVLTNTNWFLTGAPSRFDLDGEGNIWAISAGRLLKIPVATSANTKNYSFNNELTSLNTVSVLNITGSDNDLFLAKNSGNVAIRIK